MARRVVHMIEREYQDGPAQGTCTPWISWYWCGKTERYLKDTSPLTPLEQKRFDAFKAKAAADPAPICPKCVKRKERHLAHEVTDG